MDPSQLSPSARQVFKLIEFDADESLIAEVRKHWFGLFMIYFIGTFIAVLSLVAAVGIAVVEGDDFDNIRMPVILLSLLMALLSTIFTAIGAYLYKSNVVLVTSDKLAQLLAYGIFQRKISQLSIGDVQDVTVRQHGILAHAFNYGTIVIETAGEQSNYTFTYTPDPYIAAKAIVGAHEENLKLHGN